MLHRQATLLTRPRSLKERHLLPLTFYILYSTFSSPSSHLLYRFVISPSIVIAFLSVLIPSPDGQPPILATFLSGKTAHRLPALCELHFPGHRPQKSGGPSMVCDTVDSPHLHLNRGNGITFQAGRSTTPTVGLSMSNDEL